MNDLSLQKKIIIKNRSNSVKQIEEIEEKENKENIKDATAMMIYKLKHLHINLDIEKSYCYYFKYLSNIKNQKNNYRQKSCDNIHAYNDLKKPEKQNSEKIFYYPNEFYINKKNSLHIKSHVSNLFDKLREYNNNNF